MDTPKQPSATSDPSDDEFQRLLREYLERIESDGTAALDGFRKKHPDFASRLGRHLDRIVEGFAGRTNEVPERIGPYRVLHLLGRGGMGEVYLAEKSEPYRTIAAVKVIAAGQDTPSRVQRFAAEIQALALLNHDGIAKVFEAGTDRGRPYFAMEFVPGAPITEHCIEERLGVDARLQLFVRVCRAVAHAHRQGILHRDLKPSNILAHGSGDETTVKVIDFGLAKAIDDPAQARPSQSGEPIGTPDYMSPEQVDASPQRIVDTRADVYALGVVLYELLTGCLPLELARRCRRGDPELLRAIREEVPPSPSMRVASTTKSGSSTRREAPRDARRRCRELAGDLDAIVMKAIAKDPERRYGGVDELAEDVLRHLRHEPVAARRHTRIYLLERFVRRHRAGVGAAAALLTVGAASLAWIAAVSIENQRNLERGNLFGLARYLDVLRERDAADPPPPRAEYVDEMRQWLAEFDFLRSQRERMVEFVSAPVHDADSTRPELWATGPNAQVALQEVLGETIRVLDLMVRPGSERDTMVLRIDWAQKVHTLTVQAHGEAWARVRREVREDTRFGGLDLPPQTGLIPLERDDGTGLQLFWMPLPGGDPPERVAPGRYRMTDRSCPVFVLLPGGPDCLIGSQDSDRDGLRFDPDRQTLEADLQRVSIEPFFASMFEFTNGQWQLIDSGDHGGPADNELYAPTHPLCNANGMWIQHVVHAWGMSLPTSGQWEYLARGGEDTPYWCGREFTSLDGRENLYDLGRDAAEGEVTEGSPVPWADPFVRSAPVGSLVPNAYLMYDVLGNICEVAVAEGPEGPEFELRGSSWHEGARDARATARLAWDGWPNPSNGFRPVIAVVR